MNEEVLKNSIVLIGPMSVGKSLISGELKDMTGYEVISVDELEDNARNYDDNEGVGTNIFSRLVQTLMLKIKSSCLMGHPKLTRNQKRMQKATINNIFKSYKKYEKLCGGYKIYESLLDEDYSVRKNRTLNDTQRLLYKQIFYIKLLKPVLERLKKPVIIDTCGMSWIDLDKFKNELEVKADCNIECINDYENSLKMIKEFSSRFGTKIYLRAEEDYFNSSSQEIHSHFNQMLLSYSDGYAPLSNYSISSNGIYLDTSDSAFSYREPLDILSAEKRASLKNHSRILEICNEIIDFHNSIASEPTL